MRYKNGTDGLVLEFGNPTNRNTPLHYVQIGPVTLYFSYTTIVAFQTPSVRLGFIVGCENVRSATTGRHLNEIGADKRVKVEEFNAGLKQAMGDIATYCAQFAPAPVTPTPPACGDDYADVAIGWNFDSAKMLAERLLNELPYAHPFFTDEASNGTWSVRVLRRYWREAIDIATDWAHARQKEDQVTP
jgi:hypothetical protein